MSERSSTSSSDAAAGWRRRPWPTGLLGAAAIVAAIHGALRLAWPEPFANELLRQRAAAAVEAHRPKVIIAGDSRTQLGVDERLLRDRLGLPTGQVVNLSVPSGDSSTFAAAYREFGARFAPRPIVLLGVSFFGVNDGSSETIMDDLLWSLPIRERLKLVKPGKALCDAFLPEKFLWLRLTNPVRERFPTRVARYTPPIPASLNVRSSPAVRDPRGIERVTEIWFARPNIDGVRWSKFARDVAAVRDAGIQVVIVDLPCHPMFTRAIAGTPAARIERRFHEKLASLCADLTVPLLAYDPADLKGADLDEVFMDLTHLNEAGAAVVTDLVAMDLRRLIAAGQVRLPESAGPAPEKIETVARADTAP